jgi:cytoskeletal protein RodZ
MSSLGKDLAAVRKHQGRSLDEIYEETRVPLHILKSIEDDTIFSDIDENNTYIRSFIRSYAKALRIDTEIIIEALDQAEKGTYSGLITKEGKRKGEKKSSSTDKPESSKADTKKPSAAEPDVPRRKKQHAKVSPEKMTGGRSTSYSPGQTSSEPTQPFSSDTSNINWADMGKKFTQLEGSRPIWIVVVAFIAIAVAGGAYWFMSGDQATTQTASSSGVAGDSATLSQTVTLPDSLKQVAQPDTAQSDEKISAAPNSEVEPEPVLPDTLEFLIYAAYDKLEPVRVLSDVNNRLSPYWIEHEEAMRFEFVDSVKIRGQYNRMLILYNGHQVNEFLSRYYDQDQQFVIFKRDLFTEDKWYTPAPDTLPAGVPQPTVIRQRPQF